MSNDNTQSIQQQVEQTLQQKRALSIHGSGSHQFMLPVFTEDQKIDMSLHQGIIDYQPTELVIKARAGTPVSEIQQVLAEQQQQLATDFPIYDNSTTLGGAVAIGHSGSSRPFQGAIRDHILGAGLINGSAEILNFGGQVMKNVAGYDVSRLLAGSRGTLGPILDITQKVLPVPEQQVTIVFDMQENKAIEMMNKMAGHSLPITASAFHEQKLFIRLGGTDAGVSQAQRSLGGEALDNSRHFWLSIQQQTHEFFKSPHPLWRIIVPATTPELELEFQHKSLIDWCGGLRWIHADEITQTDFIHIRNMGGYIESHRTDTPTNPADLMSTLQQQMHVKIKTSFDPEGIFNPSLSLFKN
ncbi:MAG: glycolate oxidase subunit GlcE [Gammaproteobacteria bacterium]|nr:glycolate oxidase subunit GlcE [Gammaproteobacteria bacterium]